jgi:branched-chain amino acid transport system substrate-binding protein
MSTIKVGVITDQTGPLSFMGMANANVARMVIDDINANGGLLGRQIELCLEDSQTDDAVAATLAKKLIQEDHVDVILGGIYSSTRQAIKGPAVVEGKTLYIYPEQYEGQEYDPLLFCTGPVPAQQLEPFIPWFMEKTGARKFYLPSADYIWPQLMNKKVRELAAANGGEIVGEEYFPLDYMEYAETVEKIIGGGKLICTYFDENFLNMVPARHVEGLYSCLDFYEGVGDPFGQKLLGRYNELFPGEVKFTAGSACTGMYRGLKLWEAAVKEAGSLKQDDVVRALDHAKIDQGPGGPAEMVPGEHHVRMNMYVAQARNGNFEVVKSLGAIDPKEDPQLVRQTAASSS